jgi:hypothetical protein
VNNGEQNVEESPTAEETRIRFHQLVKRMADTMRSEGVKARSLRTSQGGPNTRPLKEFEQQVMTAALALAGQGELAEITARVNQKPTGDSAVFFTLSRLEGEGFISSEWIRPTETETGKLLFKVTEEGESVLAAAELAEKQRELSMQTMTISLPAPLKEFVDNQTGSGGYSSASEYICELIREDAKRKKALSEEI